MDAPTGDAQTRALNPIAGSDTLPVVAQDGSVHVPAFSLPFSSYASEEARRELTSRRSAIAADMGRQPSIANIRKTFDDCLAGPNIARQNARFSVSISEQNVGGVFTQIFTPTAGVLPKNEERILVNLHGGGFMVGGRTMSQVESIPLAATGRIRVISIDYRMAPEFCFPAASEDVAAVYRELLNTYRPENVAIYGCSAGGTLTAQAIAWFQKLGLPRPAAVAILSASADRGKGWIAPGDSAWISPHLGSVIPLPSEGLPGESMAPYFAGTALDDPYAAPARSPAILAQFPPTIFLTGTRASEMSAATRCHIDLVKAGVDARLFLWDGLDHGFMTNPELPESREAYDIMTRFFDEQMNRAGSR